MNQDLYDPSKNQGYSIRTILTYSSVPNRRAGPNKRAGGKILEKE